MKSPDSTQSKPSTEQQGYKEQFKAQLSEYKHVVPGVPLGIGCDAPASLSHVRVRLVPPE